jgi:hypothetical protein
MPHFSISARVLRSFGLLNGQREMRKRRKPRYMETLFAGTSMVTRGSMLSNQAASQTTSLLGMAIYKWERLASPGTRRVVLFKHTAKRTPSL